MPVSYIREDVLYLYVNGEYRRCYEGKEELYKALDSLEQGDSWVLCDKTMGLVDSGVME